MSDALVKIPVFGSRYSNNNAFQESLSTSVPTAAVLWYKLVYLFAQILHNIYLMPDVYYM